MKTATKAVTATASTGSVVGGGYTIYHFSSTENVSPKEEQVSSFKELKDEEELTKVVKEEQETISNETVEAIPEKKEETKSVPNAKPEKVDNKKTAPVKKLTPDELYREAIKSLTTFSVSDLAEDVYKDKFIGITKESHLPFLVKSEANEKWWEWSFNNKHSPKTQNKTNLDPLFVSITKGFSDKEGDDEALNQACKKAYNKPRSAYSFDDSNYLLTNISDFCTSARQSFDISEPKVVAFGNSSLTSTYKEGLMGVGENKNVLVNPSKENDNYTDLWWKWSFKYRMKTKTGLTSHFSDLNEGYTEDSTGGLNGACHKVYEMSLDALRKEQDKLKLLKEIKQFCSLNPQKHLVIIGEDQPSPVTITVITSIDQKYQNKLLDLIDLKNISNFVKTENPTNEPWWEWVYEHLYLKERFDNRFDNLFKGINEGYSERNNKALNKVCESAYVKEQSDYSFWDSNSFVKYIGKFCSKAENKIYSLEPKTVHYADSGAYLHSSQKIAKGLLSIERNKSNLVPASKFSNNPQEVEYWWEWAWGARFPKSDKEIQALSPIFQPVDVPYGGGSDHNALNRACEKAYGLTLDAFQGDSIKDKLLKEVNKFCTVDPTKDLVLK